MVSSAAAASTTPSRGRLIFAVFAVFSLHISTGAVISWPSPTIPRLGLSPAENALLSSLFSLGAAPGPVITTLGLDTIGRKKTLYIVCSAFLVSWAILLASQDLALIYLARVLGGIGIGGSFAGVSLYVAEICDAKSRGPLGSLLQSFIALGLLVEYCIGPYVSFRVLALVSFGVACLFPVVFYFTPESPHYLVAKGRNKEAFAALRWLRGGVPDGQITEEISQIQSALTAEKEQVSGLRKLVCSRSAHRGVALVVLMVLMQQGSGANAILAYVEYIFQRADLRLPSELVPILVGLTNLFASLPTPLLVSRFGNKLAFSLSTLGAGVSLILVGVYFYLLNSNYDVSSIGFLPVASILFFNVFFCLGMAPLVWSTAADLFSPSVKGMAMGLCGIFSAVFGFLAIELFSSVLHSYGMAATFFGFGIYLILGGVAIYLFVPNTSRMSFQEIQDYLEGEKR